MIASWLKSVNDGVLSTLMNLANSSVFMGPLEIWLIIYVNMERFLHQNSYKGRFLHLLVLRHALLLQETLYTQTQPQWSTWRFFKIEGDLCHPIRCHKILELESILIWVRRYRCRSFVSILWKYVHANDEPNSRCEQQMVFLCTLAFDPVLE